MKKFFGCAIPTLALALALASCSTVPTYIKAITPFELNQYLGTWYEIARIDFAFEKDLDNTTAEYSLNTDGTVQVKNSGHNVLNGQRQVSLGVAKIRAAKDVAELQVSFFGPFFAGYNVIALDPEYRYAMVAGNTLDYLWILSRGKTLPDEVKQAYLELAKSLGYDTSRLVWVAQNPD